MEEEIKAEFERNGFSLDQEDEILKKCHTFCINFELKPSDLVSSWEIYFLNRQLSGSTVQDAHMDGFLSHLQNEQLDSLIKEEPSLHIYSSNDVEMIISNEQEDTRLGSLNTPMKQSERLYSEPFNSTPEANETPSSSKVVSNRMTPFGQRANKFVLQFAFNTPDVNDHIKEEEENLEDDVIRRVRPGERCSLQLHQSQPQPGCRFMYDRIEDRFNSLENRIRRHTSALVASGLYGEPTDATLASQKHVFVVGMVCCDGEGHLNEKSILIQGSVEHCGGQRVRLDLHKLDYFSLFPGQVIGIVGHNPSGHYLIASEVIDCLPLSISPDESLPPAKKQAMDQEFQPASPSNTSRELSLVIAAGPFTTTDNLLFEPLIELLAYASRKQPQLLIMLGPFLDSEHPEIKKGTVNRSFDEIFRIEVLRRLQDYAEYMGSSARVVLLPSTRDANHDFVFPQPAFDIHPSEDLKHQITCLANPGIFNVNEVIVGCCTVDILKQLSSEEIWRMPADKPSSDRMGRLATHLLSQRSFYPLYPPSIGVPLDLSLAPEALQISSIPNILILPSDLAPFMKVLSLGEPNDVTGSKSCLCVNPGRLAKGIGGGTFVELKYHGDPDRATASIIRI
ncbi:DNA polymerase alpha 2 [Tasmannia lanceolata]|uniref:DNA polymerase alpha 2 n=1 Tax=Tasmannia lanceolata TaxID=3420 RepID=UPI004063B00D